MSNKQGKLILGSFSPEQKQSAAPRQPQGKLILGAQPIPSANPQVAPSIEQQPQVQQVPHPQELPRIQQGNALVAPAVPQQQQERQSDCSLTLPALPFAAPLGQAAPTTDPYTPKSAGGFKNIQPSPARVDDSSPFSQSIIIRVRKRRAAYVSLAIALSILVLTIVLSTQLIFANTIVTSPRKVKAVGPIHPTVTATATLPNNYKDMVSFLIAQGRLLYYGNPNLPEIALTFDDGPGTYTSQVLSILHKYAIQASFFNIGENVVVYPDAINQVHAAGYPIGDHTWDHRNLTKLSEANIQSELLRASDAIKSAIGAAPTLFRPPYGSINDHVLRVMYRLGFTTVMWSDDSEDWKIPGVKTIVRNVLSEVSNGSIILMHDGGGNRSQTLAALPRIISTLLSRGYRFVTIPQMIQHLARDSKGRVIENQPSNTSPFPQVPPGWSNRPNRVREIHINCNTQPRQSP